MGTAVQHKADQCYRQNHQKDNATAAEVGLFHKGTRNILTDGYQFFGGMVHLIHDGFANFAVSQQFQTAEIHTAAAEIGGGKFRHREKGNTKAEDCLAQAEIAPLFIGPDSHQRERPEQKRIGTEDGLQPAGQCRGHQPPMGAAPQQGRRGTGNDQCQHIMQCFGRAAKAARQRHPQADQAAVAQNLLTNVQPRGDRKHHHAQCQKQHIAPEHRVNAGAEQASGQAVNPDKHRTPGTVAADVGGALVIAKVAQRAAVGNDADHLAVVDHFVVIDIGRHPHLPQRGAERQRVKQQQKQQRARDAKGHRGRLFQQSFQLIHTGILRLLLYVIVQFLP